jgi:predicted O-methyltransferase YrrM
VTDEPFTVAAQDQRLDLAAEPSATPSGICDRGMDGPFDIIFNDIDKEGYPDALPVIEQKLKPGGLLIIDNMLWHGRIFDPEDRAASTDGVREFTRLITDDDRWIVSLLPVRDGIIVATKR